MIQIDSLMFLISYQMGKRAESEVFLGKGLKEGRYYLHCGFIHWMTGKCPLSPAS